MVRDALGVKIWCSSTRARGVILAVTLAFGLAFPTEGRADVVTLRSGRTMVVRTLEFDGSTGRTTLHLATGGTVSCEPGLIVDIQQDESLPAPATAAPHEPPDSAETTRSLEEPSLVHLPFGELVAQAAAPYRLRPSLVHAIIDTESGHRPDARSPKGAVGLMQLMPSTAAVYGVSQPADADANVHAGVRHLYRLLTRYPLPVALAAYNAGEGAVLRHGGIPPFAETQRYVERVLIVFRRLSGYRPAARAPLARTVEPDQAAGPGVQGKWRVQSSHGDSAIISH